jgi:uncharacterized membrane protein
MITPISIVFPDVAGAQQGLAILKDLHGQGLLAVYGSAVLAKDTDSRVRLEAVDEGPFGLTVGGLTGGILGLPAGPVGAALGAAGGSTLGAFKELIHEQGRDSFLQRTASQMPPGWSAVAAELAEFGDCRLEARMGAIGGLVMRDARSDVAYQGVHHELREIRTSVGEAWSEYELAVAQATAAREAHLEEARTRMAQGAPRLKLLEAYMQAQMVARIAQLQAEAEQAGPERRAELECQIAQTCNDHNQRRARLEEAWTQAEAALAG